MLTIAYQSYHLEKHTRPKHRTLKFKMMKCRSTKNTMWSSTCIAVRKVNCFRKVLLFEVSGGSQSLFLTEHTFFTGAGKKCCRVIKNLFWTCKKKRFTLLEHNTNKWFPRKYWTLLDNIVTYAMQRKKQMHLLTFCTLSCTIFCMWST